MSMVPSLLRSWRHPAGRALAWASVGLVIGTAMSAGAHAANAPLQTTSPATAAVANSCVIASADSLAFGAYSPIGGTDALASGQLALRCTKGAAFTVAPTSGGSRLQGSGGALAYTLYIDSALSKPWGSSQATGTLGFDTSKKYSGGNGTGVLAGFQTILSAAQFAANPAYASQPYGVQNNSGVYRYFVNYVAQPLTPTQLGAFGDSYPNGSYINVNNVILGSGSLPANGMASFVMPADTVHAGSSYQVPTGYSGALGLSGTASTALSDTRVPYYGKIPAGQDMTPGAYTDTVVFTVSF